jgi:putative transposase
MARQLRVEYRGAIYHVTVRSNAGADLFGDDDERTYWVYRLGESARQHGVRVYLYCQMTTHFHLVVETPHANLGRFMLALLTGYSVFHNRRRRRHGHVTQGRYGARLVAGDAYLLKLSRYVHLNPVKVKPVKARPLAERLRTLREYRWSSLPAYVGRAARPDWLVVAPLLALVPGGKRGGGQRYRAFVEAGVAEDDEEFKQALGLSARCIGDADFREDVEVRYRERVVRHRRREDAVRWREQQPAVSAEAVLRAVAEAAGLEQAGLRLRRRGSAVKAVTAWLLCRYAGLTQREAAPLRDARGQP